MKITAHRDTSKPAFNAWRVEFQMEWDDTLSNELPLYDRGLDLSYEPLQEAGCDVTNKYADVDYWLERGNPDKGWGVLVFLFTF